MNIKRIGFLFETLSSVRGIVGVYTPLLIALSVLGVAVPFATGHLIDTLAGHLRPYRPLILLSALLLFRALLTPLLQRFINSRSRLIEMRLQFRVLEATTALTPARLAGMKNGELVSKLARDTYAVGGFVRGFYPRLLQAAVMMFAAGCALYVRSPILAIAFMAFFPVTLLLFTPFARKFSQNSHRIRICNETSFNSLFDFLTTLPLLRTMGAEQRFANQPIGALGKLKDGNDESDALSVRFGFLLGLLLVIGEITVLGIAGTLAAQGKIPVGDVVLYQMLFITAIQSVQGVITLLPDLAAVREGADSLAETLGGKRPDNGSVRIDDLTTLSFRNVTFAYPGAAEHPVIKDFSVDLTTGSIVGLSGVNGAGKSTLLKLAVNALEPQQGEILVNGHPFSELDCNAFRRRIGLVSQDGLLISGTIRDNITLRNPDTTEENIRQALALSGFDTVLKRLPDGLDTIVGNTLRTLSGGERQRLALARAIIRNPMILILDEATNHLDVESRRKLAKTITLLRPGRLILIAGHDPELDKLCDRRISCQVFENPSYITV